MHFFSAALVVWLVAGCATPGDVSSTVNYCCGPPGKPVTSYSLKLVNVPGFLVPYLRDELEAALVARGLTHVNADPTAFVTLTYSEIYPDPEELLNDGFGDAMLTQRSRRFIALVTINIQRAGDGAEILRGTLSRMHTVSVGEYMHEKARGPIREGFDQLLKPLPRK
jgi:hypothetical protein